MEYDFHQWFDLYFDTIRKSGYNGLIDRGSAEMDYNMGMPYDKAAEEFIREMQ